MVDFDPRKEKEKTKKKKRPLQRRPAVIIVEIIVVITAIIAFVRFLTFEEGADLFTADDYYERAELRLDQGDYSDAVSDYTLAIANDYEPVSFAYFGRARAYTFLEQDDEAIEDYTQSIANDPNCAYNCEFDYNNRALLHRDAERYDQALSDFTQALEIDPDYTRARRNRAQVYELLGNEFLALRDWDIAISDMEQTVIERGIPVEGGEREGSINEVGTQIHYVLPAQAGTTITARIIESDFDTVMLIRASDGTPLAYNDDLGAGTSRSEIVDLAVPIDDEYRIVIAAYADEVGFSGDFVLNVRVQTRQPVESDDGESELISNTTANRLTPAGIWMRGGIGAYTWADNASALYEYVYSTGVSRLDMLKQSGSRRTVVETDTPYNPLAISHDESLLAVVESDDIQVFDAETGERLAILREGDATVQSLAFDNENGLLAVGDFTGDIVLYDTVTWQPVETLTHEDGGIAQLVFFHDAPILISGHNSGVVQRWNTNTFEREARQVVHEDAITALAISPNGLTLATAGDDGTIHVIDARTLDNVHTFLPDTANQERSVALAFSPDDSLLVSGDLRGTMRVWDMLSRKRLVRLNVGAEALVSLAWRNDMSALYSVDDNKTITIWRVARQTDATTDESDDS
jgi:tetratricopeptide (TPR) repeat protein